MHRAVGQLLLDRIDLAVKPIPELSAHLQGILPDDNTDKLHPALMGMHPTQTEAETDDRIDHRVPNLARDGAAVIPEPAATLGTAMLGNVAVTDCMEHGHIPRLGNEVCGQTADDENPVLPQQGLIRQNDC